jgi:hypothetical protein
MESAQVGPMKKASLIFWTHMSRLHINKETDSSLWNSTLNNIQNCENYIDMQPSQT